MILNSEQKELANALNRRLKESSKFWYQCVEEYHSVDDFLSSLNALIQSLRNITFILQSHKHLIPNFENWYAEKQEKMKNDVVLKQLNEARVEVVKRKDLKLRSYAAMNLLNWTDVPLMKWEIDPFQEISEISLPPIPEEFREFLSVKHREPLIKLERRWVVDLLSNFEVLQTLAYCYRELRILVMDAYRQANIEIEDSEINKVEKDNFILLGETPEEKRVAYYNMQYERIGIKYKRIETTNEAMEEAKKRYSSLDVERLRKQIKGKDVLDDFEFYLESAKLMLKADKTHVPIAILYYKDKPPRIFQMGLECRTALYGQIRSIANKIKEDKTASGIIIINEMWISSLEVCKKNNCFPSDDPDKKELLSAVAIRSDGSAKISMNIFNRNNGEINFEEEIENTSNPLFCLDPILDAWNLARTQINIVKTVAIK